MYKYYLQIGDPSNDGHGQSDKILITSSHNRSEITKAAADAETLIGIDFDSMCSDYEDNTISAEDVEKLIKHGWTIPADSEEDENTGNVHIYQDAFVNLYMWLVKTGNPEIQISKCDTNIETIDIGGYGLFGG